jgi:hypothetical protein
MAAISYAKHFFVTAGGEHYRLHWLTGGGGGLSNRKVATSVHETAVTGGGRLSNGKVGKDDSAHYLRELGRWVCKNLGSTQKKS